ncbi:MAG: DUF1850 domain-containing protein [Synergistaceae bacterium]
MASFAFVFFIISLFSWHVDFLEVSSPKSGLIFSSPCSNGYRFSTRYIHSVELTPVEDYYIITGGKIWLWEERVRSSKAGMPSMIPMHGRYIEAKDWLIYQGGQISFDTYFYRIGDKQFGCNQAKFSPFGLCNFYEIFSRELLSVKVTKMPFYYKKPFFSKKLYEAEKNVEPINKPLQKF